MVEPVTLTIELVKYIVEAANEVTTNREECERLGRLAKRTLAMVIKIERRLVTDQSLCEALSYLNEALTGAHAAINDCCKTNWFGALLYYKTHSSALTQATNDLDRALSQMSLAALETTLDIQDRLATKVDGRNYKKLDEPESGAHYANVLKTEFEEASLRMDHGFQDTKSQIGTLAHNLGTSLAVKKADTNKEDFDGQDDEGQTLLCIASNNNSIEIVRELIAVGATVDLPNKNGESPLYIASSKNHIHIVKELIAKRADVNLQDNKGWSALHIASQMNSIDIFKELIANAVNVNLQTKDGWSALHIASSNNHIDIVKELVANGADVNLKENDELTPLHIASLLNHIIIVKELITNGANIDLRSDNGNTALHIVASCGLVHVAQELVKHGASKSARNYFLQRPYDVVCTDPLYGPYDEVIIEELKSLLRS